MSSIFLSCFSAGRDPGTTAGIIIAVVVVILIAGGAVYYKRKKQMEEADISKKKVHTFINYTTIIWKRQCNDHSRFLQGIVTLCQVLVY